MATLITKTLLSLGIAMAACTLAAVPAAAAAEAKTSALKKPGPKKSGKTKLPRPKAIPAPEFTLPDPEPEPDITDNKITEFKCELGNKITIYAQENNDQHIALRWKKRLHRLTRVGTTTGALRFENKNYGLVWIGIPSKGMLLDSKLNRQLANECKNAEQELAQTAPVVKKP